MGIKKEINLVINDDENCHAVTLMSCLRNSIKLECMVAFATMSGLNEIREDLNYALERKFKARFVIGLDFYQTDPELLTTLFNLSENNDLSLFISNSRDYCYHPKVYAFKNEKSCHVLIGSANLTSGGLYKNNEVSALIEDTDGEFMESISDLIDQLIQDEEIILATRETIKEYGRKHAIYQTQQSLTKKKISRAIQNADVNYEVLRDILLEMKQDQSESGFNRQRQSRNLSRDEAKVKMNEIINTPNITSDSFIALYEPLAAYLWHSGGLERGKNIIAAQAGRFQIALTEVTELNDPSVEDAYSILHEHFNHIPRAGTNVITEILHTMDNERFAVMNKNSVAGMSLANIHGFPASPQKGTVTAQLYNDFCTTANDVREALGLSNFTELDALFNYAYWD
ncbi:MAG: phospholipase D family protein [Methyloprofundus sp.]|nr:phospholipase D family protein [Methyloprofundus sp.]